jgi:hypothetical protein
MLPQPRQRLRPKLKLYEGGHAIKGFLAAQIFFQEPNEPDSASGQIAALLHAAGHDLPVAVDGAWRDDGANGIGAAAIANPLFGTTTDQIAALRPPRSDTPLGAQQEIGSLSPLSTAR